MGKCYSFLSFSFSFPVRTKDVCFGPPGPARSPAFGRYAGLERAENGIQREKSLLIVVVTSPSRFIILPLDL